MGRRSGPNNKPTIMRIVHRKEDDLLSYVPTAWKMLAIHEAVAIGREFTTIEGVDGGRDYEPGGHEATGKRFHWRVATINVWHFTGEFISPGTKANGQRRSFLWSDVMEGRVTLC